MAGLGQILPRIRRGSMTVNFSSSFCTSITSRKTTNRPTSPAVTQELLPVQIVSSSDVRSVCSLLSDRSVHCSDFDDLLNGYRDKVDSTFVLKVLMNYRQLGRVKTLEFFTWAGRHVHFQFDDSVVEFMSDFLGRRKLFDDMKGLLATMLCYDARVSCRVFSICIRFLGRQGRVREALCLFEEMESRFGCKPDNFVYNNMLYVLCKKEKTGELIDVALTLFQMIKIPDVYSYSNILVGLSKFGRLKTAMEVFDSMSKAGLVPTRSAVNLLIGELCSASAREGLVERVRMKNVSRPYTILVPRLTPKINAIGPALDLFWGVHRLGMLPSAFIFVRLITELCRLEKTKDAFLILEVVEDKKMNCLEECYAVMMLASCEHRRVKEASNLFGKMLSLGLKMKLTVYNSMISMFCKIRNLDDAEQIFKIMNKKRCLPDTVTYTSLLHAYAEMKNWKVAYDLSVEMLSLGFVADFSTFRMVEELLRDEQQFDLCLRLECKRETQILLRHCKVGKLEDAYRKLDSMVERGIKLPLYANDALKNAFHKSDKSEAVFKLLEKMEKPKLWLDRL